MLQVNGKRLLQNLKEQAEFGRLSDQAGGGIDRRSFSEEDRAVRAFFMEKAKEVGLRVQLDAAANLSACLSIAEETAPTILLGSHLDSVPNGGALDGALGVWAALEVLTTAAENQIKLPAHLEAIAFTDEEGRLGDLFGSRFFSKGHTVESIDAFLEAAAQFPEDLRRMQAMVPEGLTRDSLLAGPQRLSPIAGFLELHIEQGPRLEHEGKTIGIVDSIFGRRGLDLHFFGCKGHAGTTPMSLRADALIAAAHFITQASEMLQRQFPRCVLTCGNVEVSHGAYNVIPAEVKVWVEFRAPDELLLSQLEEALENLAKDITSNPKLSYEFRPRDQQQSASMDEGIQAKIEEACRVCKVSHLTMPSGALHDAQMLTGITRTGMIFVPSMGGHSHTPLENTNPEDIVAGANVLLHSALQLAEEQASAK